MILWDGLAIGTAGLVAVTAVGLAVGRYPGRTYHQRYRYPYRWALVAELWWRVEHLPIPWLRSLGYRRRKAAERRGYDAVLARRWSC